MMVLIFALMKLPYSYDALEPFMDARTVEIHYTKHHQGYVNNLNAALEKAPDDIKKMPLEQLLVSLDRIPENIRMAVRNNGGGVFAHDLFWTIMAPKAGGMPSGKLAEAITRDFGSFEKFKESFSVMAKAFFGSGWVWLVVDNKGKLSIMSTLGHDIPLQKGFEPIMVIDVWEHAYYLKYQNRRPEYIENWWNLVNWQQVEGNYSAKMTH
jgi:superoxide dismutase, Fe-Mn family